MSGNATAPFRWTDADIHEVEQNYLEERSSLWMYNELAKHDRLPERAEILRRLASFEERHSAQWAALLRHLGHDAPRERHFWNHRILVAMARLLGVGSVLPIVNREEVDGIGKYRDQARRWQDPAAQSVFVTLLPDEVAHEIETSNEAQDAGAKRGNSLRSLLLGAIDGFASVVALAAGVAAVTRSDTAVLIAGAASVAAGALSMAASEYVSVKAEQEAWGAQTRMESEALDVSPDTKRAQLVAAYEAKGLSTDEADAVVRRLAQDPKKFVDALVSERYGPSDAANEEPGRQGMLTGVAFALAGIVPLVPYFFLSSPAAVIASVAATCVALFIAGLFRALSSLHPFIRSGLEMVAVGMAAAAGTYLIGLLIGGVVS